MAKGQSNTHTEILRYALPHLEQERERIQAQIDHIHRQLGQRVSSPVAASAESGAGAEPAKKRVLSAAARKRIAAAQKKRWAEHRKAQAAQTKGKPGKSE